MPSQNFHLKAGRDPVCQKVNLTLEQAMKAQRGTYSSTLSLTSASERVGLNVTPRRLYPQERVPVPIAQEAEWA